MQDELAAVLGTAQVEQSQDDSTHNPELAAEAQAAGETQSARPRDGSGRFAKRTPAEDFESRIEAIVNAQDETPPAGDESQTEVAATKSGEGPSADLLTLARLSQLPEDVIAAAKDDDALRTFIRMADRFQAPAPQPSQTQRVEQEQAPSSDEPLAKLLLSDEDFPKDDVIRQQAEHFVQAINTLRDELRQELDVLFEVTHEQVQTQKQRETASEQSKFDSFVDGLGVPVLGKRSEFKDRNDPAFVARNALWRKVESFKKASPELSQEQLVKFAYEATFNQPLPTKQQTLKRDALVAQSQRRLAGHTAPPALEPELPDLERFERRVAQVLGRS